MQMTGYGWRPPAEITVTSVCRCGHEVTETAWEGTEERVRTLRAMEICKDCQEANADAARALRAECEANGTRAYLRYGRLPAGGRSWNSADSRAEAGVSVYRAYRLPGGRYVMDLDGCELSAIWLADRDVYVVRGRLLDERGSDGEPLLADASARKLAGTATLEWL